MTRLLVFALCTGALGCGSAGSAEDPLPDGPLTVDAWRELPVDLKYDEATFDRLREADPQRATPRGWDAFLRDVVVPERKQDGLGVPGARIP